MSSIKITRKEEITNAAAHLFRVKGYAATTMRDLASEVGMEAASLYNHIKSKQELLSEICDQMAVMYFNGLKDLPIAPVDQIEKLIRHHIQVNLTFPELAAVAEMEWGHLTEPSKSNFLRKRNQYELALKEMLRDAIASDEIAHGNLEISLYTILSALQWLHHWYRDERPISPELVETEIVRLILNGLKR